MACPTLLTELAFAPTWARYSADLDHVYVSALSSSEHARYVYPSMADETGLTATAGGATWAVGADADDSIFRTSGTSLTRYRFGAGLVTLASLSSVDGVSAGSDRAVAYSASDDKLYVLANGNSTTGLRLLRFAVDGTYEATVYSFDPALYASTITGAIINRSLECFDGILYGVVRDLVSSTTRYAFAYDIAADTCYIAPSSANLASVRGTHHDGCGIFADTVASTYVRMYPDGTLAPLGCETLGDLVATPWLTTYAAAGRTLYVAHEDEGALVYRIYEEVLTLDVPTLALDQLRFPFPRLRVY